MDSGADMLIVTSYAADQSAYNMIEHAWSPLSNRLTSVKLPAVLPGETKPPNKQTELYLCSYHCTITFITFSCINF